MRHHKRAVQGAPEERHEQPYTQDPAKPSRRRAITQGTALAAAALAGPWVARYAHAQAAELGPYLNAKINWRQAEGTEIAVAVIPAS